ncbi:double zinc ribbon domain-containing protein [Altererythrobacter sp. GH1-8]|uniref:double zinc ribbon domain-containing protein n=1 Tax=Altererythrobacter sp. GH1-8 TaxID=3349333 RepID=UPI00374D76FA
MNLGKTIAAGLAPVVDLVYPPRCPLCGDAIARQNGLCTGCWSSLAIPGSPQCRSCSRPFGSDTASDAMTCAVCLAHPPNHSGIAAGTLYNDASRQLVLAFKHGGKIALAPMLAGLIAAQIADAEPDNLPLIIPVPLHRWRLWKRGYNQAALLGRELEKLGKGQLLHQGLARLHATPSLGGLGRSARQRALAGSIAVPKAMRKRIISRNIILVDDVMTSGATSDACVKALLKAGAETVTIACFARVLDEALDAAA